MAEPTPLKKKEPVKVVSSAPRVTRATDLPVHSFTDFDSVGMVKNAIRSLEHGIFDAASQVVDAMGRDDRIEGVMSTRAGSLAALPMEMKPKGKKTRLSEAIATELQDNFETMFPDAALTDLMKWGLMLGLGVGELIWQFGDTRWDFKLKVWHPRMVHWRWDTRSYWLHTQEGNRELKGGDGQFVLFQPYGEQYGWMKGKVRSLYIPWLIRQWAMRDWARYSEVHGTPIRAAMIPSNASKDDAERFFRDVAGIGTDITLKLDRGAGGTEEDTYDVKLIEAVSNSWETFDKILEMSNTNVAIALLGQNLTTEVKGGSYAAAMIHALIRADVLKSDAQRMGQCLREQALIPWVRHNFAKPELTPMPTWQTDPGEDTKAAADSLGAVGDGVNKLRTAGFTLDAEKVATRFNLPVKEGTTSQADLGPKEAAPAPQQGDVQPNEPPKPKQKGSKASQLSMFSREDLPEAPVELIEGQLFVDDLAEDTTKRAAAVIATDLAAVLSVIEEAKDLESLRSALTRVYGKMDRAKLAKLIQQALTMANLAGRHSANAETEE